ncbi:DUF2612 domain-containing protein [Achromobacter aegrifaciens]
MTTNIVNVFEPAQFGIGDGATTQFQIGGPHEVVQSIAPTGVWRQDWQGNQRLFPTERINNARWSEDAANAVWAKPGTAITVLSDFGVAPDGTVTSDRLVEATTTAQRRFNQSIFGLNTRVVTQAVFIKPDPSRPGLVLFPNSSGPGGCLARFDLQAGVVGPITNTGTGIGTSGLEVLPNGWFFAWVTAEFPDPLTSCSSWLYFSNDPSLGNASYAGDGVSGVEVWGCSFFSGAVSSYIKTEASAVSVIDYTVSQSGLITMGQVPDVGASLTWTGSYTYEYQDDAPTLADRTVISQYANSPTLLQLIRNMDAYINPQADFDAFYDYVWNVETAQGFGLDIWGRIVGVGRMLTIPDNPAYFGFQTGVIDTTPFNDAPFYAGQSSTSTFRLADDAYRLLIMTKALANISDSSSASINRLLQNLFAGRGRCYVNDLGGMNMRYTFEFYLQPFELAILTQSNAVPKPAAVGVYIIQAPAGSTFGFSEANSYGTSAQPFGQGTFIQ